MSTISIRVAPLTGRKAAGQIAHDLRSPMPDGRQMPDYVDATRSAQNTILLSPPSPQDLRAEIAGNRKTAGQQSLRADARTMVSGIITFGRAAQGIINALSVDEQNALYARVARRIERETKHPLLSLVVHRDESAPHAHFMLRGYRLENGEEVAWRFTPQDMSKLQDLAAEEVSSLGITRGTKKSERIARGDDASKIVHRSVEKLHADLPKEIQELEQKRERYASLLTKAKAELEATTTKAEALKKRVETYERRVAGIERELGKMPELPAKKNMLGGGYTVQAKDLEAYRDEVKEWATRSTLASLAQVERERAGLRQERQRLAEREARIAADEKFTERQAAEISALKAERAVVGRKIGDALGVENASMRAGAIFDAVARGSSLQAAKVELTQQCHQGQKQSFTQRP